MRFWNKYHLVYDKFLSLSPSYSQLLNNIVIEMGDFNKGTILDLGAGPGEILKKFAKNSNKLVALDYSAEALSLIERTAPQVQRVLHDMREPLPFPDNLFDFIISINAIYALRQDELMRLFSEIYRVAKSGSKIIIVNPLPNFSNLMIFFTDIMLFCKANGIKASFIFSVKNIGLYLKLFYYNIIIDFRATRKIYRYLNQVELISLLEKSQLKIGKISKVYANQAIMAVIER